MKIPYLKHLHNTHLIPSIKQREKGVKPKSVPSSKNDHQQIIHSHGFRDQIANGTLKTSCPSCRDERWVDIDLKRGLYHPSAQRESPTTPLSICASPIDLDEFTQGL